MKFNYFILTVICCFLIFHFKNDIKKYALRAVEKTDRVDISDETDKLLTKLDVLKKQLQKKEHKREEQKKYKPITALKIDDVDKIIVCPLGKWKKLFNGGAIYFCNPPSSMEDGMYYVDYKNIPYEFEQGGKLWVGKTRYRVIKITFNNLFIKRI